MTINKPLISVVIATHNAAGYLQECLESVLKSTHPAFEVIVVDNASTDGSVTAARVKYGPDARVRFITNAANLLFTGGYNAGFRTAKGSILIALNNDTECEVGWLEAVEQAFRDPSIGAAQPAILVWGSSAPEIVDYAGAGIDRFGFAHGYDAGKQGWDRRAGIRDIFYAGGTAFVVRREVIEKTGAFDERFGMHWEDTDLSWRVHLAGYRVVLIPAAVVYHKGSLTMKKLVPRPRVAWFVRKNRLAGLIKNYSLFNAVIYVPCLVLMYVCIGFAESIRSRQPGYLLSSLSAVAWNARNIFYLLRERKRIGAFRVIKDRDVMRLMCRAVFSFI